MISPGSVLVPGGSCWDPALALVNFTHGLISTQRRCPLGTRLSLPWQCQLQGPRKCQLSKELNHRSHGCGTHYKQAELAQIEDALTYEQFSQVQLGFLFSFLSTFSLSFFFGEMTCFRYSEVGPFPKTKDMNSDSVQQRVYNAAITWA